MILRMHNIEVRVNRDEVRFLQDDVSVVIHISQAALIAQWLEHGDEVYRTALSNNPFDEE